MPDSRIFEGKTTNEAIEKGLKELKVSKNDVEIKIVKDEEKRSFFDILTPRVVKVEIIVKEKRNEVDREKKKENTEVDKNLIETAKTDVLNFLDSFLEKSIGEKIKYESSIKDNVIIIAIEEQKADFLIGYRGETLNALQTILTSIAIKNNNGRIRVELDVLGYR